MNIVERVVITGFWGDRTVEISFREDANFLIGVNGSGKTTAINLLAAALQADFATLDRIQFKSVMVFLKEVGGRRKPSIQVAKKPSKRTPYSSLTYSIRDQASGQAKNYSLDEIENQRLLRSMYASERHVTRKTIQHRMTKGVLDHLHQLVNVNWLSIHRSTFNRMYASDDESYESTIDKKLKDLGDGLVRFFSALARRRNALLDEFQQRVFLSLIELPQNRVGISEFDLENLTKGLKGIYEQFGVDTTRTKRRLKQYTTTLQAGLDSLADLKGEHRDFKSIVTAFTAPRVAEVVGDWWQLQDEQAEVDESKTTFLNLLNEMLLNKEFVINESNELVAVTESGKRLHPRQLSSGEKQLLIILGDALLTEGKPHVYIADEPELSLHIEWQEKLISTLRKINPEAQVIVATHSPDIVGSYQDRTVNMVDAIS